MDWLYRGCYMDDRNVLDVCYFSKMFCKWHCTVLYSSILHVHTSMSFHLSSTVLTIDKAKPFWIPPLRCLLVLMGIYVYVYVCIYIYREREREREIGINI